MSMFESFHQSKKSGEIIYTNQKMDSPISIQVIGQVQGVGFRQSTQILAQKLGIQGGVQNENDGSVYIEAQGNQDQISQFIEEVAKGPSPASQVEKIYVTYDQSLNLPPNFTINN